MDKAIVIAEIGCNHKGDMEIAKELITTAKIFCKADAVKFQKRNPKECLSADQYNSPHPNPSNSYGETYGAHREFLEFNLKQHRELKKYCDEIGIIYSSSVWDLSSAKEIISLEPEFVKIPSACNNNYDMLKWICDNFKGNIHVSVGMTSKKEIDDLINFFIDNKRNKDVVIYSCTSGYPVPFEDICLLEISYLRQKYEKIVNKIGFSGHHLGIAIDIAAYTLGATYIERHYTLDRTWKGTDHSASLEPDGIRRLVRDLRATEKALKYKKEDILDIEKIQRKKLKNS